MNFTVDTFRGVPVVTVAGGGIPIVVLSGGDAFVRRRSVESHRRSAARIARLFPPHCTLHILGYDPNGSGEGEELIDSVTGFMKERTGPAIVAAISFGGLLALRLAASNPELVRALILISATSHYSSEGRRRVVQQLADVERGDLVAMARPFLTLYRRPHLNALMRLSLWLRRRSIPGKMNAPAFIARMLKRALAWSDTNDIDLARLRTPTLVVIGERDQFYDASGTPVKGSMLVVVPRETHMLPVERPGIVRSSIDEFLTGVT